MSSPWTLNHLAKPSLKEAIFIEGLPGIGNVGKVVVDYLIEQAKAKKIVSFFSHSLPNSVFVNEENLIELPKIEVYHATIQKKDFLFMTGDVQPSDEEASYEFCELVIKQLKEWHVKHIITLGGIGLHEDPEEPRVYCTGNDKKLLQQFIDKGASNEVYGIVGPIIGVSGLLLGLSMKKKMPAVALLAETLGHPMYLGLRGAKSLLQLIMKRYDFTYSLQELDEEIADLDNDDEPLKNKKLNTINKLKKLKDTSYIG